MKTKRSSKKWLPMLLLSMLMAVLFGMSALAQERIVDMAAQSDGTYQYIELAGNYGDVTYHRISVPASGILAVAGGSINSYSGQTGSIDVKFCNSQRKELSSVSYVNVENDKYVFYGVKAGTYYLKVSGYKTYVISAAFEKTTDKGGAKKSKAYTLKQGKSVKGVMPIGEKASAADWYKFKVKKGKVLNLEIQTAGNGYLRYTIYGPSYKKGLRIADQKYETGQYRSIRLGSNKKSKIKAGTYYIKVTRAPYDKKASGAYSIKWK